MFIALIIKEPGAPAERHVWYVPLHTAPTERDESRKFGAINILLLWSKNRREQNRREQKPQQRENRSNGSKNRSNEDGLSGKAPFANAG